MMSHDPGSAFVLQVKVEAANADGKDDCSTTANADDHANPDEVGIVSEPTGFLVIKNEPIEQSADLPEQESGVNRGISYARDPINQSNSPALQTENVSNLCNSANMEISAYEDVVSIRTEKNQQLEVKNHTTSTLQLRKDTKDDGALKFTSDLANSLPLLTTNMPFSPESNPMVSPTAAAVNERDASHLDYHQLLASIGEADPTSLISPTTPSDISNTAKDGSRFQCTKCQKSYKMKSSLRDHMRIHTGERPYKCYICPQIFRLKRQLDRHVADHVVPEQFPATTCQVDNMDQSAENYIMSASSSNQVASTENEWSAAHGISADVLRELLRFTASKTTGLNIEKLNVQRRDPTYLHSSHQEIPANDGSTSNALNSRLTDSSGVNVYSHGGIKRETIMPAGESSTPLINGEFQTTNGVKRRNTLTATSDVAHLENETKKSRKSFPQLGTSLSAMQYNGVPLSASNCINGLSVLRQSPSLETEQEEATPAANTANQDGMKNLEKAEDTRVNPVLEIIDVSSDEEASDELDLKQYPVSAENASICNEPVSSTNAGTSIEQFMPLDKGSNGFDVSEKSVKSPPIFTIKLEDSFENQPNVCHGSSSLVDEVQKVALLHPENVFLVWAEKFSLDLTMAVARNWSNCFLCVRNFPLTSLVDLSTLVKTYHISMVEIGPHAESYRLFSFGEYFLPPEILRNDAFESLAGLESTIKQFADSKGKRLVNIFKSAGDAVSLYEVLREELKEDCFVTKM